MSADDDYLLWPDRAPRSAARARRRALAASIGVLAVLLSFAAAALTAHAWPTWLRHSLLVLVLDDDDDDNLPSIDLCVFVHGAGSPTSGAPSGSDPVYWGDVHERLATACAHFRFLHADTLNAGWEDAELQQRVCDLFATPNATEAPAPAPRATPLTVVFAHSLGNLILAGALDAGRCALPAAAAWFAVAAPWEGSPAADRLPEVCAPEAPGVVAPLVRSLATRQHFCDGVNGTPSTGYLSTRTSAPRLRAVAARWVWRVNGSLCGDDAFGLWSRDSFELQALSDFARFCEPNDGAVPTRACHQYGVVGARAPDAMHLTAHANHYDLTCRHGDAALPWSGADRKPCAWYEAMARRVRRAAAGLAPRADAR